MQKDELSILETVNEQAARFNLPANGQKPCITALLSQRLREGYRNLAVYIVATDILNRQQKSDANAENILLKWNQGFLPPLPTKEVINIIKYAGKTKYNGQKITYGCNREPVLLENCIGKVTCPYYKDNFAEGHKQKTSIYDFLNSPLFIKLQPSSVKLYLTLVVLEKKKNVKAGSYLVISHRGLAKETGMTRQTIAEHLKYLHFEGLIAYTKGKQHKYNKTASEIRRILPIPG